MDPTIVGVVLVSCWKAWTNDPAHVGLRVVLVVVAASKSGC